MRTLNFLLICIVIFASSILHARDIHGYISFGGNLGYRTKGAITLILIIKKKLVFTI